MSRLLIYYRILSIDSISINLAKPDGARGAGDIVESQLAIRNIVIRGVKIRNASADGAPMISDVVRDVLHARSRRAPGVLEERTDVAGARDLLAVVVPAPGVDAVDVSDKERGGVAWHA